MDNVIQNVNIDDIIPSNTTPTKEEEQKIEELAILVKQFGMIDPILVRPKDGKYEIILGIEKYHVAKLVGLTKVPIIVRKMNDETFSKYINVENGKSNSAMPTENKNLIIPQSNQNSDIINLSELNQKENERDDLKMNNVQLNNDIINNNLGQPQNNSTPVGPTFGGRFFPSLEDEPTNMNMMEKVPSQTEIKEKQNLNNNLIDLTDLSIDKEQTPIQDLAKSFEEQKNIEKPVPVQEFSQPIINSSISEINVPTNNIQAPQSDFAIPNFNQSQETFIPKSDNIINLETLQNNNPVLQPILDTTQVPTINNDFGIVNPVPQSVEIPQSTEQPVPVQDFSQPIMNNPISEINPTVNDVQIPQSNFEINNQNTIQPEIQPNMIPTTPEINPISTINTNIGETSPISPVTMPMTDAPMDISEPVKDIIPVTNTIKSLVSSLEAFGYKININEEELATSVKLTIEVEK